MSNAPLDASQIKARAQGSWPAILTGLGIEARYLRNRHGPCPACGGKDRFRFDDREGHGTFYCNQCGSGDGFHLLERVYGWSFPETLQTAAHWLGMEVSSRRGLDEVKLAKRNPGLHPRLHTAQYAYAIAVLRELLFWLKPTNLPASSPVRGQIRGCCG